ncbi:hypothetical protein MIMGU_mgv1a015024mg [Erythranthe guttata]|uniref:Uncharacterized protein n=1 Tax=Erythranthe guttata TaxID=4155 RepID=A0A022PYH9_ERYGU|nr:hypothetical protein MIMGU_mgv1a015024mg [Erythranthe guttata]
MHSKEYLNQVFQIYKNKPIQLVQNPRHLIQPRLVNTSPIGVQQNLRAPEYFHSEHNLEILLRQRSETRRLCRSGPRIGFKTKVGIDVTSSSVVACLSLCNSISKSRTSFSISFIRLILLASAISLNLWPCFSLKAAFLATSSSDGASSTGVGIQGSCQHLVFSSAFLSPF